MFTLVFAKARVGVELDSDQFVGPGVDYMPLELHVFHSFSMSGWQIWHQICKAKQVQVRDDEEGEDSEHNGFCFHPLLLEFVALKFKKALESPMTVDDCMTPFQMFETREQALSNSRQEITQDTPIPIMPVHFFSFTQASERDGNSLGFFQQYGWA